MANPIITKLSIGGSTYELKDAKAHESLSTLEGKVGALENSLSAHLEYVVEESLPTASASTMSKVYLIPHSHDGNDNYDEYITLRSGEEGAYTYAWEKIGNTDVNLSGFALKDHVHDYSKEITVSAYEFTPTVASAASGAFSGEEMTSTGSVTAAGIIKNGEFTGTEGVVNVTGTATGNVSVAISEAAEATGTAYQPKGTVSKPAVTVTPTTEAVNVVTNKGAMPVLDTTKFNGGELPSFTEGAYTEGTAASLSTNLNGDTLEISFTPNVPGKKAADTFTKGAIASLGNGFWTAGTNVEVAEKTFVKSATAALDEAPIFEGTAVKVSGAFSGGAVTAAGTFTPAGTISAEFEGNAVAVSVKGTPEGTVAAPTVTLNKVTLDAKNITVSGTTSKEHAAAE